MKKGKKKICHLMGLDYCCLNIQLSIECDDDDDVDDTVYCTMEQRHETNMKYALTPWLYIHGRIQTTIIE
jgi:isopentenyldiphosphate isomerase